MAWNAAHDMVSQVPRYFRMVVVDDRKAKGSVHKERDRKGLPGYHDATVGTAALRRLTAL